MFAIFKKEISGFFSNITGYLVIIIFITINSLFMWILPGEFNIPETGYASLDTLFLLSPWIFLFLVPAITMRMISEEKRLGTIELLFSKPVSERSVIYGKFLASVFLVLMALLPALVYYMTVYFTGETTGNIDNAATAGSFIGLFLLASVYAAAGIFTSSLTSNQVVAFVTAVFLCFFLYTGFDYLALLPGSGKINEIISLLGINEHYKSVSRGVIDSRDMIYFIGVAVIFTEATRLSLLSGKWKRTN